MKTAIAGLLACALGWSVVSAASTRGEVRVARIDGSINPASVDYLIQTIEAAERDGAAAVLIELDTPGGLVAATLDIVGTILNADVPVIVHVTPRGAMASSAGVFITMAAHVAVMAPSTTIGAAHPVSAMGSNPKPPRGFEPAEDDDESGSSSPPPTDYSVEKIENVLAKYNETIAKERGRNVTWAEDAVRNSVVVDAEEALELGVIDLIADSRSALIEAVEGRTISVKGEERPLSLAGASFVDVEMTFGQRFFNFLSDPNVASVLLMAGLLGLYIEFNSPGLVLPGAAGAVCLVMTAIAFQILPFSWVGFAGDGDGHRLDCCRAVRVVLRRAVRAGDRVPIARRLHGVRPAESFRSERVVLERAGPRCRGLWCIRGSSGVCAWA